MSFQPRCQYGHTGPWRYVEAIEVWRDVRDIQSGVIEIDSEWHTGDGYDGGIPGTAYLLCWAAIDHGARCADHVQIPPDAPVDFDSA